MYCTMVHVVQLEVKGTAVLILYVLAFSVQGRKVGKVKEREKGEETNRQAGLVY